MIVRILSRGSSFQGLATYLTHDPRAKTAERVGWTHTLNCANDDIPSAVSEMVWTARDAELLKQEAGIRAGGRATENPVKHASLNWAPDEKPTREHMIATTEDFLRHMRWDQHQAILVAHTDKSYAHVHIALNTINPATGLKLDDNFEQRRAQAWALEYERQHGIHCEQRLENIGEREPSPTRPAWQAFKGVQQDFEEIQRRAVNAAENENAQQKSELNSPTKEWEILKQMQRDERLAFFAKGRAAFSDMRNSIFREVREEFRPCWREYYGAKSDGADSGELEEMKAKIVNEQKSVLEERRDAAYGELRETRDALYQDLLAGQREARAGLRARQAVELGSLDFMDSFRTNIHDARNDTERASEASWEYATNLSSAISLDGVGNAGSSARSTADAGARVADGLATGVLKVFEFFADSFSPPSDPPERRAPPPRADDAFAQAAADARRREQIDRDAAHAREEEEERLARRSRSQQ